MTVTLLLLLPLVGGFLDAGPAVYTPLGPE